MASIQPTQHLFYAGSAEEQPLINILPPEVLVNVLERLTPADVEQASLVCRFWRDLSSNPTLLLKISENFLSKELAEFPKSVPDNVNVEKMLEEMQTKINANQPLLPKELYCHVAHRIFTNKISELEHNIRLASEPETSVEYTKKVITDLESMTEEFKDTEFGKSFDILLKKANKTTVMVFLNIMLMMNNMCGSESYFTEYHFKLLMSKKSRNLKIENSIDVNGDLKPESYLMQYVRLFNIPYHVE